MLLCGTPSSVPLPSATATDTLPLREAGIYGRELVTPDTLLSWATQQSSAASATVLPVCDRIEMIRSDAAPVAAEVVQLHAFGHGAVAELPRPAMRAFIASKNFELSITVPVEGSRPVPTLGLVRKRDLRPEPYSVPACAGYRLSGEYVPVVPPSQVMCVAPSTGFGGPFASIDRTGRLRGHRRFSFGDVPRPFTRCGAFLMVPHGGKSSWS